MNPEPEQPAPTAKRIGRYALHLEIAAGGMATVHIGRLIGQAGFSRTVAIKRLHPQFAKDPEFVAMFLDEARLAARIHHPNVVSTLDVVSEDDELFLVMDYIQGESLSRVARLLAARGERLPLAIVGAVIVGALNGLHAAHEAHDERGAPLQIVHRDVSPQNILIGADGIPRVIDFGVAKAAGRLQETRTGQLKGKFAYMAPEQFGEQEISRSVDVYAAAVVLWEVLTGQRLFGGSTQAATIERVLYGTILPPTSLAPGLPAEVDAILARGLARAPVERFATAQAMAAAVEKCLGVASMSEVAAWLGEVAGGELQRRADLVAAIERASEAATSALADAAKMAPPPVGAPAASVTASMAAATPPPARTSVPDTRRIDTAEKRADDTVARTSLILAARAPEAVAEDASPTSATGAIAAPRRRRTVVAGSLGLAAILGVTALVMASASAPGPGAPPAAAVTNAANTENSSPIHAPEAPSAEVKLVVAAPSVSAATPTTAAPKGLRPAIRTPPASKVTPPDGGRRTPRAGGLPADIPSERN